MKQFTLILLVLSLLTGCSAHKELPEAPPDEKEAAQVPSDLEAPDSSLTPQFTLPVTEEALRTYYQAEEIDVQEILPCERDFLVYGRTKAGGGVFHWVYGQTGVALPLFSSGEQVFSWEVLSQGQIRVVHGGENTINAALSFPSVTEASAVVRLDESGRPAPAGSQWGDETTSAYVAPLEEAYTFGWDHGPAALVDVRLGLSGAEVSFGPTADNPGSFFAAASSIPLTDTAYDSKQHTLTLTFREAVLTSGTPSPEEREAAPAHGLPTEFSAGPLPDTNDFISRAEVRETPDGVQLILTLTEQAQRYTAECGQLLPDQSRPYLRVTFSP